MKKFLFLMISCILCSIGLAQVNVIETELQEVMNQRSDEMIDVTIILKSQIDQAKLKAKAEKSRNKSNQRDIIVSELKNFSKKTQSDIISILEVEERNGNVSNIEKLWITNAINCKASKDVIYLLSTHPDIKTITYNKEIVLIFGCDILLL